MGHCVGIKHSATHRGTKLTSVCQGLLGKGEDQQDRIPHQREGLGAQNMPEPVGEGERESKKVVGGREKGERHSKLVCRINKMNFEVKE